MDKGEKSIVVFGNLLEYFVKKLFSIFMVYHSLNFISSYIIFAPLIINKKQKW